MQKESQLIYSNYTFLYVKVKGSVLPHFPLLGMTLDQFSEYGCRQFHYNSISYLVGNGFFPMEMWILYKRHDIIMNTFPQS